MMNGDYGLNIEEILRSIDKAEVMALYFPLLQKTLLMDTRFDEVEGPMLRVVPMVASVEERFRSLRRMRPRFPRPEGITIIPWPKRVSALERYGIWERLVRKYCSLGFARAEEACQETFRQLVAAERAETLAAILGQHYHTLWESPK